MREPRKPLSQELDAVVAACRPDVDRTLAALDVATDAAYEALKVAKVSGVSTSDYDWLNDEAARRAASALFMAKEGVYAALDDAYNAQMNCSREMEESFHGTDAWVWIDGEEVDEAMAAGRGFADAFHEGVGYEFDGVSCNVVARRLECPTPKPAEAAP